VTGQALDKAEMYSASESVWETLLLVGLPFVGCSSSLLLIVLAGINLALQATFCLIVFSFMSDTPVDEDALMGLLGFRMGVAHSVKWADSVNHRSMATQVCDADHKMHLAGGQRNIYDDFQSFGDGGDILSVLIQFCWLLLVMAELNNTFQFCRAIVSARSGPTQFVTDGGDENIDENPEELIQVQVVTRMKRLSKCRKCCMLLFSGIPRFALAVVLWYAGVVFLLSSGSHADLILNGVALGFILDIDEYVYSVLAPQRVKTVFANFEPMPVAHVELFGGIRKTSPAVTEVLKLALMCGLVAWVYFGQIRPLFLNIAEAQEVLCGGVQNFVYAENSASSTVYAVRTKPDWRSYTQSEKDVLQMAKPNLTKDLWPNLDASIFELTRSNKTKANIVPTPTVHGLEMEDARVPSGQLYFNLVKTMDSSSAIENAGALDCDDYINAESFEVAIEKLRAATHDSSINSCKDAKGYCQKIDQFVVRALCPTTCGCDSTVDMGSVAGFFGSPMFGCPTKCATKLRVTGEVMIQKNMGAPMPCQDWGKEQWEWAPPPAQYYIWGLFEYLTYRNPEHYQQHLEQTLSKFEALGHLSLSEYNVTHSEFVTAMMDGTIRDTWKTFDWTLGLGVPHPRGLKGCGFLTSFEVTGLLGIDLCDVGEFRSLRSICATSCGCVAKPNAGIECPSSCNHPGSRENPSQIPQLNWENPPAPKVDTDPVHL
jgi:hypothetical protein